MPAKSFRICEKRLELGMEGKYQWLDLRNSTSGIYYPAIQAKKHAGVRRET